MNDRIVNRISMARRALTCLNKPEHSALWAATPPMIFGTKVAAAGALLTQVNTLAQKQTRDTTGSAEDKAREEKELEDICYTLGNAIVECCLDAGDAAGAAPFRLYITDWRELRDEILLQRAYDLATAIAADAPTAAQYGLDTLSHSQLVKETNDFRALIVAPDDAISGRKSTTAALSDKVQELLAALAPIDRLIVQYKTTPAGETFIAAYFAARNTYDRGHGPAEDEPAPTPIP